MGQYFWPFCRIAAFFMVVPIIGTALVSMRIRLGLALAVTAVIGMTIEPLNAIDPFSSAAMVIIVQQILIGVVMAFVMQFLFQVFSLAGQMIAMQNGLGFGTLIDPVNGIAVTSISQLYLMTVNLLFFTMNGHLILITMLAESFGILPIGNALPDASLLVLVNTGSWLFGSAVLVAWPAVIALLVVNFTFGVISRVAPQMNIISIGFPFTMVMGLIINWFVLGNVQPQFDFLSAHSFDMLRGILR